MLKKLYPSALALVLALTGFAARAQSVPAERGRDWCGSVEAQEIYFAAHPGAREAQKALFRQLDALGRQHRGTAGTPDVTIPVVVHVIHAGGAENISDRQIFSAIDQLNIDYQKLNPDTVDTVPQFKPIAASIGFQFRLAKKDPNGGCSTGITRHYLPNLINDNRSGNVQNLVGWDRNRYLNIYVVGSIGTPTPTGGTVLGYAFLPQIPLLSGDGFVVRNDFFGNQGTSTPRRALSRVGTHEIGHYFSLLHPWGNNNTPEVPGYCNDTDFVADTPPTNGTFSCDLNYMPCGTLANVQNFMDYAACPTMFTQGQKERMRDALAMIRTGLTTPANLAATGTADGFVAPDCAPIAAFGTAPGFITSVCVNTPITLRDYSYNFTASGGTLTYTWSFPGGNPSTATGQTVTVSYPTAGFYTVTETVSNRVGSSTSTVTNYIRVEGPTGGETAPFAQSFEDPNFPALFPAPTLRNYETFGTSSTGAPAPFRWVRQTAFPAADGVAYLVVQDRLYPAGAVSTLITPNINLAGVPGAAVLSFARAYALRAPTTTDELRISFSSDCGQTWSAPTVLDAVALSTQGVTPIDGYVPAASTDWQTLSVPIPAPFQGSGLFKIRFQMVNGSVANTSNNFYFDNLRVSAPLASRASALARRGISVYPNPLTHETAVHLTLTTATQVQLRLTDVLGREVLTLPAKIYGAGPLALSLGVASGRALAPGVYVVRLALNGETFTSKLTVE